jgi:hypothetical protein
MIGILFITFTRLPFSQSKMHYTASETGAHSSSDLSYAVLFIRPFQVTTGPKHENTRNYVKTSIYTVFFYTVIYEINQSQGHTFQAVEDNKA